MTDALVVSRKHYSLVPQTVAEGMELAKMIANSDLAPKDYKGKSGNVFVAMQMGLEVGLSPMQAIQNIAVINGRPSLWGDAMLAVCQAAEGFVGCVETFDEKTMTATCIARRSGREDKVAPFSMEDAKKAGLWGKQGPWTQYPKRMLQMRARAFALRDQFAAELRGLQSAEEVRDIPPEPTAPKAINPTPEQDSALPSKSGTQSAKDKLAKAKTQDNAPAQELTLPEDYLALRNSLIDAFVAGNQDAWWESNADPESPYEIPLTMWWYYLGGGGGKTGWKAMSEWVKNPDILKAIEACQETETHAMIVAEKAAIKRDAEKSA